MKRSLIILLLLMGFQPWARGLNGELKIHRVGPVMQMTLRVVSEGNTWLWDDVHNKITCAAPWDRTFYDSYTFGFDAPKDVNDAKNGGSDSYLLSSRSRKPA